MKRLKTIRNYDFFEVASALQKAIRRNDPKIAGYFAIELFESGFINYVWKRLLTASAEDCKGIITKEIMALYESFKIVNKPIKFQPKGRIFISKAVILLCKVPKSRDADHLQNLIYDEKRGIKIGEIEIYMDEVRKENKEIPDYAFDCHTLKGKINGKTKDDFFKDELKALNPYQTGLFDNLVKNGNY